MHWRQVDVVCERASGIPCVCVVLLEGVGCMEVGRLHYWCNWLVGVRGLELFIKPILRLSSLLYQ